jgi:polysaccharide pyruvyl transferase WcaK-like protein
MNKTIGIKQRPKVAFVCEHNSSNLGDQAIAFAIQQMFSDCFDLSFIVFGSPKYSIRHECGAHTANHIASQLVSHIKDLLPPAFKARIRWYLMGEAIRFFSYYSREMKGADIVLIGGGQLVKNNIALFCEKISILELAARMQRIPVGLVGVGVDEKMTQLTWLIVRDAMRRSVILYTRDRRSSERIILSSCTYVYPQVAPDLVFCMRNDYTSISQGPRTKVLGFNIMSFGVLLRSLGQRGRHVSLNDLKHACLRLFLEAHRKGIKCEIFTTGSLEDNEQAEDVKAYILAETGIEVKAVYPKSLDSLLHYLSALRDVLAMRMHAGILAYVSSAVPVCLGWDDKVVGVWSLIAEADRVFGIDDFVMESGAINILQRFEDLRPASVPYLEAMARETKTLLAESILRGLNERF